MARITPKQVELIATYFADTSAVLHRLRKPSEAVIDAMLDAEARHFRELPREKKRAALRAAVEAAEREASR
jgi:hypothetical protein